MHDKPYLKVDSVTFISYKKFPIKAILPVINFNQLLTIFQNYVHFMTFQAIKAKLISTKMSFSMLPLAPINQQPTSHWSTFVPSISLHSSSWVIVSSMHRLRTHSHIYEKKKREWSQSFYSTTYSNSAPNYQQNWRCDMFLCNVIIVIMLHKTLMVHFVMKLLKMFSLFFSFPVYAQSQHYNTT